MKLITLVLEQGHWIIKEAFESFVVDIVELCVEWNVVVNSVLDYPCLVIIRESTDR